MFAVSAHEPHYPAVPHQELPKPPDFPTRSPPQEILELLHPLHTTAKLEHKYVQVAEAFRQVIAERDDCVALHSLENCAKYAGGASLVGSMTPQIIAENLIFALGTWQ